MKGKLLLSSLMVLSFTAPVFATQLSAADKDFMALAARAGKLEVELGNLAEAKAEKASVKNFAKEMINDHTKASNELKALASKKSEALPADLVSDQKELETKLSGLSGKEFDKTYMDHMVKDHEKVVQAFRDRCNKSGGDADLTSWAKKTLPTLEHHLQMAKDVDKVAAK